MLYSKQLKEVHWTMHMNAFTKFEGIESINMLFHINKARPTQPTTMASKNCP